MSAQESSSNQDGDAIMLAQFAETHNDWRYQDGRVEGAVRLYVSTCALLATVVVGIIALYPDVKNSNLVWWVSVVLTPFLFALGVFTARRVKNSTISRERRMFAISLAKRYFQDKYPKVAEYLPVNVRTADALPAWGDKEKRRAEGEQLTVSFPDGIVLFVFILNSCFCGLFFYSVFTVAEVADRLRQVRLEVLPTTAVLVALAVVVAFLWQNGGYRASKRKFNRRQK